MVERRLSRFVWSDPRVILDVNADPAAFRAAMSAVHVGGTYKITGSARHTDADDLLLRHVALAGATVVDIGASDGSTSLDLLGRLPEVAAYVIADLYLRLEYQVVGRHTLFYEPSGACVLVVGRGLLAWPAMSPFARSLYAPVLSRARRSGAPRREVLLLNPDVREVMRRDPRLSTQVHDVFQPWPGPRPDVVKVANLLRRLYFDDETIGRALVRLHEALPDGGHLLVLDNPRIPGIALRAGLYRRTGDGFATVATTAEKPEILDLVLRVSTGLPKPG